MSYNGSGTFTINSTGQPVVAGTVITASAFNALTTDLATGLTTAITKDGQTTTTARITFAQGITSSLVTDSSSVSTGSIITAGGAGIAKNLYVGGIASFSAQPIFTSLTASSAVATDASKGLVSVTNTGTGNNVLATSPTLVTPTLGAASATSITVASGAVGTPSITTTGDTNTGIYFPAADTIAFTEGGSEAMRINSSGLVGIGETSILAKLHVKSTSGTTTNIGRFEAAVGGYTGTSLIAGNTLGSDSSYNLFSCLSDSDGDGGGPITQFLVRGDGNVGIGTTSPNYALEVNGSASVNNLYKHSSYNASMAIGNRAAQPVTFITDDTERMRILSGGAVCVNTTTSQVDATSRLVVATTTASGIAAEFTNNTSGTCAVAINNTGAATSTLVNWYAAGSFRSQVTWNGSLIVYGTTSDARLKENITDAGSGLAKLANVKIRSFNWKESGAYTDFGVVAQELQAVAPDAVLVGKDNEDGSIKESWSVDSSVLVPAMIKAIQELKAINDSLTARIVALESK